ncbi:MAG TPA: hypothetical protein VIC87_03225, partial [Vicinamibacteria bacterium]
MTARPGFSSRATGDAAALLLLLGAVAVLFLPALTARGLLFFGDTTNYALRLDYTGQWLKAGRFPLWNPLLSLGAPHAVDTGAQTFYPPHVLLALLFGDRVYDFDAAFHVFLAAVGMFAWARTLRCSRAAALLAALAYSMGGFALGHLQHLAILVALGWIPVVLASTERYLLTSERRFLGLTAWAVGLLLLGGHPQISLYGLSALGCYGLFRLATLRRTLSDARPLRLAGGLALSLALGLAVASLFLLPFGEWMHFVSRTERVTSEYATAFSLPTKRIWTMVAPFWFGGSPDRPQQAWQLIERSSYVGLLPLALAAVALARPTAPVLFLWGLASLALLLALGDKTPLYDLVLLVPVFRSVRAPARFLALSGLALALLAGRGLDTLRTGGGRRTARSIALAFLALVASVGIAAWLGWEAAWPLPARGDRVRLGQADTWTLVSMLCGAAALLWRLAARRGVQARVLALCLGFVALDLFSFKARLFFYRPAPWTAYEEPSATARVLEGGGGAPRLFTRTGTELETMVYEDGDFHGYR